MTRQPPIVTQAPPPLKPGAARTRLLLEGPIASTLLRLAAPNVVVNIILIAVTASVDAHFVGQLGSGALAGLSLVFPLMMLMQQMANSSMGGAIASAIARAIGSGRREDASALVVHALVIAGAMAGIFTSVFLVAGPAIYGLMGGEGAALAAAIEYSNAIFAGALAYWLLSALTSVVRGTGQSTVLAIVYMAAEGLHVLLVPVLVFGFGPVPALGVTGAGVATLTSFTASSAFLAWYIVCGRTPLTLPWRALRLERRFFAEILRVGGPMSLQPVLNNVALATLTGFVGMSGPVALAAFGAAVRLEYVLYPLTFGFGAAVLAMVGTNLGAGQVARASRIAWTAGALGLALTAGVGLFGLLWPGTWIGLFSTSPDVHALATTYMCIAGLAYPFIGLGLPLSSALQAAGRPLWPLLGIASRVLMVAAGGWIVVHMTGTGLSGLAVVSALGIAVYGSMLAVVCGRVWRLSASATMSVPSRRRLTTRARGGAVKCRRVLARGLIGPARKSGSNGLVTGP
jgi:putative MATE family efflux protein